MCWYVEVVRNTPLLLQLFFWISSCRPAAAAAALSLLDAFYLTNRASSCPARLSTTCRHRRAGGARYCWPGRVPVGGAAAGAADAAAFLAASVVAAAGAGLALPLTGATASFEVPALSGFNIRGGYSLTPEFAALLTGLTVKFSASIAEIVRAGIQSVRRGQWEAARAMGLHDGQIMRLVVLPQALRVITPLTTSNYLDLVKDSSLAVAIGYPDLVSIVNTTANTTGQAFEALLILIVIYLALNLAVSALMNLYKQARGAAGRAAGMTVADAPLPPALAHSPARHRLRAGLFGTPFNAAVTALTAAALAWLVPPLLRWTVLDATFSGTSATVPRARARAGLRRREIPLLLFAFYPPALHWRPALVILLLLALLAATASPASGAAGCWRRGRRSSPCAGC